MPKDDGLLARILEAQELKKEVQSDIYVGGCLRNTFYKDGKPLNYSCSMNAIGYIMDEDGVSTGYYISGTGIIFNPEREPTEYCIRGGTMYGPDESPPWIEKK